MIVLEGYKFTYCGKCRDGFIQNILPSGELIMTPCECKKEQDKQFLFKKFFSESRGTVISYFGENSKWTFENYKEWFNQIETPIGEKFFNSIYEKYLKTSPSLIVLPSIFHKMLLEYDFNKKSENFFIASYVSDNKESFDYFYSNFIVYIMSKRLISSRLFKYPDLLTKILDYGKLDIEKICGNAKVLVLCDLFSDDFISSLKIDFKYDKISQFFYELQAKGISVFAYCSKHIVELHQEIHGIQEKVIKQRALTLLELILSKSNTLLIVKQK